MRPVLSNIGHGALGFRSGLRDVIHFFDEPGGEPQAFAEVRLGHAVQPSEWAADSGIYSAPFYRALDGVPLDVVAVQTIYRSLTRVESVAACAATDGTFYYPSSPTSHGAWDTGETWDGGGLWDRGSFLYVNVSAAERASTAVARVAVGWGTDAVSLPILGPNLLADGGLETDPATTTDWTVTRSGDGSVSRVTSPVRSGTYAWTIQKGGGVGQANIRQDSLAVVTGAVYCLSGAYYQQPTPGGLALTDGLTIGVYDSGGTSNSVDSDGRTYGTSEPYVYSPVGDWRRWAFYFLARQSTLRVQLTARSNSLTTLDDVSLRRVFRWLRYEPRLRNAPRVSEGRRDKFFGPWAVGATRLELANDATPESTLGASLDTLNAEVVLRVGGRFPGSGGEEVTPEGLRVAYVGRVTGVEVGESDATLEVEDARGQALAELPRRVFTEQEHPQSDPRLWNTPRPLLWGYGEDLPARRVAKDATGNFGVYEVADCTDWPSGIAVDDAPTGRMAEVRMFADDSAAQRGDTSLSTDVTDHVSFDASTGRFTATNVLKPVPQDEEHQFYSFSFNGGAQIDCRVLDGNEETVELTPSGTGGANNFTAVGAPTIWESVAASGDSAHAFSASTTGNRRCEITCAALSGSAAIAYVELVALVRSLNGDPEDGDRMRFYVDIGGIGTRYYGDWIDEPTGSMWAVQRFRWETDPSTAGSPWTEAAINGASWGIEYSPNSADYLKVDTLIPQVRRYKSSPATASRPGIRSPKQHAAALEQAMRSAAGLTTDLYVTFSETDFKFTVTGEGAVASLTLLTKTGRQKSGWAMLGYGTDADQSGALTYTAASAYYDAASDLDAAVLRVKCMGFVDDASGTYTGIASTPIEKGPDVLRHLLERSLGVPAARIDTGSFEATRALAPRLAVYLQETQPVEQTIERLETGDLADLTLDDERYYYARRASAWATGGVELEDRDFIGGVRSGYEQSDVYGLLRVLWGYGLSAEERATDSGIRYGRQDVREWSTYLTEPADASNVMEALAADAEVKRRYKFSARGQLLRVRPGQIVRLNPVTGGLEDSSFVASPVDVRILTRDVDYSTQIVTVTAVEV